MKKFYLLALSFTATLLFGIDEMNAQKALASAPVTASALLYRIEGKGLKNPSYLFGTIHLICQKDMFNAETMKAYLDQAGQVMLEMDLDDPEVMKKVGEASVVKDGKTVKDLLKPEEYAKLDELYKSYLGMSFDALLGFKPMMASSALMMSPKIIGCAPPQTYDRSIAREAAARRIPVIGLESAEEQIAIIDSQPFAEQVKVLNEMAKDPQKSVDSFNKLYKLYLGQDSDALYEFSAHEMNVQGMSHSKLLDERNRRWIPHIETNIAKIPTFIAVGAGHLGGKNGVVNLLRAKGYTVTPIRF